jgi:hypothetical protein
MLLAIGAHVDNIIARERVDGINNTVNVVSRRRA